MIISLGSLWPVRVFLCTRQGEITENTIPALASLANVCRKSIVIQTLIRSLVSQCRSLLSHMSTMLNFRKITNKCNHGFFLSLGIDFISAVLDLESSSVWYAVVCLYWNALTMYLYSWDVPADVLNPQQCCLTESHLIMMVCVCMCMCVSLCHYAVFSQMFGRCIVGSSLTYLTRTSPSLCALWRFSPAFVFMTMILAARYEIVFLSALSALKKEREAKRSNTPHSFCKYFI